MAISPAEAVNKGFREMGRILFKPFRLKKWFVLGFIAWIAGLSFRGNFNFNFNFPAGGKSGGGPPSTEQASVALEGIKTFLITFWQNYMFLIIAGAILFFLFIFAATLVWTWLQSVFSFVFIDGLIKEGISIWQSFAQNQSKGSSYFLWRLLFGIIVLTILLLFLGLPILFFLKIGSVASVISKILIIGGAVLGILTLILISLIIGCLVYDFILPVMFIKSLGIIGAWKQFLPLLRRYKGNFTLYILLKVALSLGAVIATGMLTIIWTILLLGSLISPAFYLWLVGLALNPLVIIGVIILMPLILMGTGYIFSCLLLPIPVFFRTYSLVFLGGADEQFITLKHAHV